MDETEYTDSNNSEKIENEELYPKTDAYVWMRSCEEEIIKPIQGEQTGHIPLWLNGSLLRNGPGSFKVGDMEFLHLFDSSSLLHRFAIKNGDVTYQCRFLQSQTYKKNHAANRIVVSEFGTKAVPDPCHSIFKRISALFKPGEALSDNCMISIYPFGDELYTFAESPVIHRIDPETLESTGRLNVSDHVFIVNHTSHPHVVENGDVYNVGMAVTFGGLVYSVVHFPMVSEGSMFENGVRVADVPVRWPFHPGYMHTFGITDNYYIIIEQPLSVSLYEVVRTQLVDDPMESCLNWYQGYTTLFHVVRRSDGQIQKSFESDPFFYLHIINQYEIDGHIVIDICCYKDASVLQCMYYESMKTMQNNPEYAKFFRSRPMRYVLPLKEDVITLSDTDAKAHKTGSSLVNVTPEMLCDVGCETPRINYEKYLGKPYRYFYAIGSDVDADIPGIIIKIDTVEKTSITWYESNCYPSEPIFVPKPDSQEEDDGILLSALVWGREDNHKVGMVVLDAKTLKELGRATFITPSPAPKCLHGWFHPAKRIHNGCKNQD